MGGLPARERGATTRVPPHVQRVLGRPQVRPAFFDALVLTLAMLATAVSAGPSGIDPAPLGWTSPSSSSR